MNDRLLQQTPKFIITACLLTSASLEARADYQATVLGDAPKAYYRFNDNTNRNLINLNNGTLGAAGNASNDLAFVTGGAVHPFSGAIVGDSDRAEFFDFSPTRTEIPFNAAFNPPNSQPFTIEAWIYPASDEANNGQGVLCNRYTQVPDPSIGLVGRQGWVMYQRGPNTNSSGYTDGPGVGWEFRMYNGQDTSGHIDVTSGVPFEVGQWQYVVVVYDPVDSTLTNATASIYIDGELAAVNTNSLMVPGYVPCTGDHDPSVAVNGQPALSLGGYNNANNDSPDGDGDPFFGAIDEFAFYTNKLSPAQILAHYQNGTNANRSQPYPMLIKSASPLVYLRLDEIAPQADIANNLGNTMYKGIGTNTMGVVHPATGPLAASNGGGAFSYHQRNGSTTTDVQVPWDSGDKASPLNPNAGVPFTFETWLRPTSDRQNPGAAPFNNRYVSSGNRTGWVIFQRAPDITYTPASGYSGVGWTFRMYDGAGSSGQDVLTDVDYQPGVWQYLVVTWQPVAENGDVGSNGNDQWSGILTAYFNGVPVATNTDALYAANVNPTEDGTMPADFAVGSYNIASGLGSNPFEGDVAQVAFYNNIVLTSEQILTHYEAGTNPNGALNYSALVYSAGALSITNDVGLSQEVDDLPALYLPLSDPPFFAATNSGTLGSAADGNLVSTINNGAGPESPAFAGFESVNEALPLDGATQFASFNNPAGLNITGQITLEAWVKPNALNAATNRIISHGPQTISSYLAASGSGDYVNAITNTTEVFLRIDNSGANYSVGTTEYSDATGTNTVNVATYPAPAADLTGANWVHLVGTYDGAQWNLYRNGILVAEQPSPTGAVAVPDGNWAVGSTGMGWTNDFAGTIDEVAIYDKALSASQIAAHYVVGTAGTTALTAVSAGQGKVAITWPAGTTLQESSTVNGAYTAVSNSPISPLTVSPTGTRFYRWSLP